MSAIVRVTHDQLREKVQLAKLPIPDGAQLSEIVRSVSCAPSATMPCYECLFRYMDGHEVTYRVWEGIR